MRDYWKYGALLVLLLYTIAGCQKTSSEKVYDFSWTPDSINHMQRNFKSTAPSGSTLLWSFGDGNTSDLAEPVHVYDSIGSYTISLVVNKSKPIIKTITFGSPTFRIALTVNQAFVYSYPGDTYSFYSSAITGSSYIWTFGDGDSAFIASPVHTYTTSGNYTVNLFTDNKYKAFSPGDRSYDPVITIHDAPLYTHQICQPRIWRNGKKRIIIEGRSDTSFSLPDSTFAVTYQTAFEIYIWGYSLYYDLPHSSSSMLLFENYPQSVPTYEYRTLYYNHTTDSMGFLIRNTQEGHPAVITEISYNSH